MNQIYEKQIKRLDKMEQRLLQRQESPLFKERVKPVVEKLQNKIPPKLKSTLDSAFYKGFQLVFEKGTVLIEKTYNKESIEMEHDIKDYALNKKFSKKHVKQLDKHSKQAALLNTSFSALEGGIMGILGIGLPDIPLFLSVIMKTIYEIALSYGFPYDTPEERAYILQLIRASVAKEENRLAYNKELDVLSDRLDQGIVVDVDLDEQMKLTADVLSDALLTAKFIQGIPLVGAVGGVVNYTILNRISKYATVKYKKRYLSKKPLQ